MDEKDNPSVLNKGDMAEIQRNMGGRKGRVLSSLNPANPGKATAPSKPKGVPPTPKGGIPPIFPIVPEEEVHLYKQEKRGRNEIFGFEQSGKIDKELNEYALKEIAAERGITVEQLLQSKPDKKLEKKLEFADMPEEQPPNQPPGRQVTMTPEQARQFARAQQKSQAELENEALKAEILKMRAEQENTLRKLEKPEQPYQDPAGVMDKLKADAEQHAREVEARIAKQFNAKANPADMPAVKQHPLLKKLRQKLSIDAMEPAEVVVEGIRFGMLPPPGSLQTWIVNKISNAGMINSQQALNITIRTVLVCTSLCFIDGEKLAVVLGLCEEGADTETPEMREMLAQTLWEMAVDRPTIEGLFKLHPQLITTLYTAYDKKYGNLHLSSSLEDKVHRYTCPVTDCQETFDLEPPGTEGPFCRVHGVQMKDNGTLKEINQIPLS